jgi:hypothetical protein
MEKSNQSNEGRMSQLKYCQGPKCHTYDTKDRKKGPKDNKRNETRRRSSFYYLNNNACSMQCQADWFDVYGSRALQHFGYLTQPKVLTQENAWRKSYDWRSQADGGYRHYVYNYLTDERIPLTEEQYNNDDTIITDGRLTTREFYTPTI